MEMAKYKYSEVSIQSGRHSDSDSEVFGRQTNAASNTCRTVDDHYKSLSLTNNFKASDEDSYITSLLPKKLTGDPSTPDEEIREAHKHNIYSFKASNEDDDLVIIQGLPERRTLFSNYKSTSTSFSRMLLTRDRVDWMIHGITITSFWLMFFALMKLLTEYSVFVNTRNSSQPINYFRGESCRQPNILNIYEISYTL